MEPPKHCISLYITMGTTGTPHKVDIMLLSVMDTILQRSDPSLYARKMNAEGTVILAQPIRISDILAWVRSSYLTHVIFPRLSREACSLVCIRSQHIWSSSDINVQSK